VLARDLQMTGVVGLDFGVERAALRHRKARSVEDTTPCVEGRFVLRGEPCPMPPILSQNYSL
jgi:hypothetical protein